LKYDSLPRFKFKEMLVCAINPDPAVYSIDSKKNLFYSDKEGKNQVTEPFNPNSFEYYADACDVGFVFWKTFRKMNQKSLFFFL
jgi:hypothetical protein